MLRLKVKDDLDATITGWVTVMKIKNDEEFRDGDNQ